MGTHCRSHDEAALEALYRSIFRLDINKQVEELESWVDYFYKNRRCCLQQYHYARMFTTMLNNAIHQMITGGAENALENLRRIYTMADNIMSCERWNFGNPLNPKSVIALYKSDYRVLFQKFIYEYPSTVNLKNDYKDFHLIFAETEIKVPDGYWEEKMKDNALLTRIVIQACAVIYHLKHGEPIPLEKIIRATSGASYASSNYRDYYLRTVASFLEMHEVVQKRLLGFADVYSSIYMNHVQKEQPERFRWLPMELEHICPVESKRLIDIKSQQENEYGMSMA